MRVLVIEDDEKVAHFLCKGLRENGYAVDRCTDGEDGLHLATHETYDVIILDMMLPAKHGREVLRELRGRGFATPVVALTALGTTRDKVAGLDAGADDYVTKPFSFAELMARVRAVARRKAGRTENVLTVADLALDRLSRVVKRAGQRIDLTATEFALLEFLMRNEGIVMSRTLIAESVWDMNFDPLTNVIDVHISHLRRKVDRGFSPRLIHTVKGAGYVLGTDPAGR